MKTRHTLPIIAVAAALLLDAAPGIADPEPFAVPPVDLVYPAVEGHLFPDLDAPGSELTERGRNLRGVYVPIGRLRKRSSRQLAYWIVNNIRANAVMIDIKDDRGRITFTQEVPGATGEVHGYVKKLPTLIKELKAQGVYVIGRLVCNKDNFFTRVHPETAMIDHKTKKPWRDRNGLTWLDPYSPLVHSYIASVAHAAEKFGFDEIQLDYIRFPVEPGSRRARFPNRKKDTPRHEAIADLLATVDKAIRLPLSIDVFGLTAYHPGDQDGLGQSLEHLAPHIDAISPMLYLANWPRRVWENPKPSRTNRLVHNAVKKIRERLGDHIAVRPLLQGFRYRAQNWGAGFIMNQIDAAETAGSSGYLFWNQSGNYGKVAEVWERMEDQPTLTRRDPDSDAP